MLTQVTIHNAKPGPKPVKLYDARGLFLLVSTAGGKLWRFKYHFRDREKLLALGKYPDVSLKMARDRRDAARRLLADGMDPAEERRADREAQSETFEAVGRAWLANSATIWTAGYVRRTLTRMEQHLFPYIGKRIIREIEAPELLAVVRRVEKRGQNHTAHRMVQIFGQVVRYAIAEGWASRDPSPDLRDALAPAQVEHRAAITDPAEVGALLRAIDSYKGTLVVGCALKLAPLVFTRPGELRKMEWSEVNFMKAQWSIPMEKTKMRQPLIVPLSTQALEILRELYPVTGHGKYAFPSARSGERPMSDCAILAALRRMEIPKDVMSGHGFRATARTILDEELHVRVDLIEAQLGHAVKDPNGRAYNRTSFLPERVVMMQKWSDFLDTLKQPGAVAGSKGA